LRTVHMKTWTVTFPELALLAGTRAMLGAGLAFLISQRLSLCQRRTVGVILTGVGVLTTIPLAMELMGRESPASKPAAPVPPAP